MNQKTCPGCKLRIGVNHANCPNCGEPQPIRATEDKAQSNSQSNYIKPANSLGKQDSSSKNKKLLLFSGLLALAIFVGSFVYFNNSVFCLTIRATVSPKCQAVLGLYYEGKNEEKSMYYIKKGAEGGDAVAQLELGCMYAEGQGVPKDFYESVKWLERSAMQGHPRAAVCMGDSYESGEGVPRNYCDAYAWYLVAKAQGYDLNMSWYDRLPPLSESLKSAATLRAQQVLHQINNAPKHW